MKIVVCVKLVKVLGDEVEFTPDGLDVDPDYLEHALNEWDACALEEALQIRERLGEAEVVAVTAGDKKSEDALRRCLAMGAERAVRVDSAAIDPIATAIALASAVAPESPDLVLCGVQSSDSVQGSSGTALAERLGLPRVAVVKKGEWCGSGPATGHHHTPHRHPACDQARRPAGDRGRRPGGRRARLPRPADVHPAEGRRGS